MRKKIADITDQLRREDADTEALMGSGRVQSRGKGRGRAADNERREIPSAAGDLATLIQDLTAQMHQAAEDLHFELAARLRDEVSDLKKELRQMNAATR